MTNELIIILSDFVQLMKDWESKLIPTEQELFDRVKKINEKLTEELPKQKEKEVEEK